MSFHTTLLPGDVGGCQAGSSPKEAGSRRDSRRVSVKIVDPGNGKKRDLGNNETPASAYRLNGDTSTMFNNGTLFLLLILSIFWGK